MLIDIGEKAKIEVKSGDKSWNLQEPLQSDVEKFQESDGKPGAFADFVASLGMPKKDIESLGILQTQRLAEGLLDSLTKKK